MAGQPRMRQLNRDIEQKAREEGMETGIEYITSRILDGQTIKAIAAEFGVDRRTLYAWRNKDKSGERRRGWELAMELSADGLAEDGMEILDELAEGPVPPDSSEVSLAHRRAEYRQWLAAVRNRKRYGKNEGNVNVNVIAGDSLLDALRAQSQRMLGGDEVAGELPEAEYEFDEDSHQGDVQ